MQWHLSGLPYEVQQAALNKAEGNSGFGYLMEMGLGKSAVYLNEGVDLIGKGLIDGFGVVCPPSLKTNWMDEVVKWNVPKEIKAYKWPEVPPNDSNRPFMQVINYEAFSGGAQRGYSHFHNVAKKKRLMVGLDESVQIKGNESLRTKNLLALSPFLTHRRIMSGAPVTQGPMDAWAQLRFLGAIKGSSYHGFKTKFCKMGGWMNKKVIGCRYPEELYALFDAHGFRARKEDWTDLPPKVYHTREVGLSEKQRKHYKEMEASFITQVVTDEFIEAAQVVTQLLKLQQISSGFIIDGDKNAHVIDDEPPKYRELLSIAEQVRGKVLVFTHFRHTTTLLHQKLQKDYNAAIMIGGDDDKNDAEKARFNNDPECRMFVIQLDTGKYGHTLNGGPEPENHCSTSVYYENTFNLDTRLQSEDRNHRHGQQGDMVNYFDLVSSPVDTRAILALQKKLDIASEVVDGIKRER